MTIGRPSKPRTTGMHRHKGLSKWHDPSRKHHTNLHKTEAIEIFKSDGKIHTVIPDPTIEESLALISKMEDTIINGEIRRRIEKIIGVLLENQQPLGVKESPREANPVGLP
jgi:hypothetical protein